MPPGLVSLPFRVVAFGFGFNALCRAAPKFMSSPPKALMTGPNLRVSFFSNSSLSTRLTDSFRHLDEPALPQPGQLLFGEFHIQFPVIVPVAESPELLLSHGILPRGDNGFPCCLDGIHDRLQGFV